MFALAGFIVLAVNFASSAFSPDLSGLLAGMGGGSWSAVIALTSPWFGRLFDHGEYAAAFQIATLFPVAGYLVWRALTNES
jgi:hypothetical protein